HLEEQSSSQSCTGQVLTQKIIGQEKVSAFSCPLYLIFWSATQQCFAPGHTAPPPLATQSKCGPRPWSRSSSPGRWPAPDPSRWWSEGCFPPACAPGCSPQSPVAAGSFRR